jgi:hypothetical protein
MCDVQRNEWQMQVYTQGIADYLRYKTRCPKTYKGTKDQSHWEAGQKHAADMCSRRRA